MPTDAFQLGEILEDFPTVEVEFERVIPTDRAIIPYFWIWGDDVETIPAHFDGNPTITAIEPVDTVPGGGLFRGDWQLNDESILKGVDTLSVRSRWTMVSRNVHRNVQT